MHLQNDKTDIIKQERGENMKKLLSLSLALALVLAVAGSASAAVIGTLNVTPSPAVLGQNITVSGNCGTANPNGNVTFNLTNGSNSVSLGSTTSNASGNFTVTLNVPATFVTGSGTLTATCPNGDTLTSALTTNTPLGSLTLSGTPTLNQPLTISGSCGTAVATGSVVNLSLVRGTNTASLGSTNTTNSSGAFSTTVTIPSSFGGGPAAIVAACPNGSITQNVGIVDPNANISLSSSHVPVGGSVSVSGVCGTTAGGTVMIDLASGSNTVRVATPTTGSNGAFSTVVTIPTTTPTGAATLVATCPTGTVTTASLTIDPATGGVITTPTGGVRAGSGPADVTGFAIVLLVLGIAGFVWSRYNLTHDQIS